MNLKGKRVLVTGGGQRVGASIAQRLGELGADVAVHYHRSRAGADAVREQIEASGGRALALSADLSDPEQPHRLVRDAVAALGGLDLLVASAASYDSAPLGQITAADFDRSLALNVRAPFLLAQAAREHLSASRGSIVFVTCISPRAPHRDHAAYVTSKGALSTLTRVLAVELAPEVRVNAVAPGTVLAPPSLAPHVLATLIAATPLARIGAASDVADAVVYLAATPFVTGVEIAVDGGRSISGV
jgi:pteridine reductase